MDADAAGDDQIVARYVAGAVGCEEGDSFGNVGRGSDATEGNAFTPGGDRVRGEEPGGLVLSSLAVPMRVASDGWGSCNGLIAVGGWSAGGSYFAGYAS
jgi:hypothetical protein